MKYLPYIGRNMDIVCLFVQIWNRMWCELYSNIGNFCCFTCRFSRYSVVIVTIRQLSLLMRYKQCSELVPSSPTIYLNFKIMIFERDRLNPGSHTLNLMFFLTTISITRIILIWFWIFWRNIQCQDCCNICWQKCTSPKHQLWYVLYTEWSNISF